jgi:hypothetical protein
MARTRRIDEMQEKRLLVLSCVLTLSLSGVAQALSAIGYTHNWMGWTDSDSSLAVAADGDLLVGKGAGNSQVGILYKWDPMATSADLPVSANKVQLPDLVGDPAEPGLAYVHFGIDRRSSDDKIAVVVNFAGSGQEIHLLDPTGTTLVQRTETPENWTDVAFAPDGTLWRSTSNGLRQYNVDTGVQLQDINLTSLGIDAHLAKGIAIDSSGRMYMGGPGKIWRWDLADIAGTKEFFAGTGYGTGDDQFSSDRGYTIDIAPDGRIVIGDSTNKRVKIYDPDGTLLEIIGADVLGKIEDVAVDDLGNIYVSTNGDGTYDFGVHKFTSWRDADGDSVTISNDSSACS